MGLLPLSFIIGTARLDGSSISVLAESFVPKKTGYSAGRRSEPGVPRLVPMKKGIQLASAQNAEYTLPEVHDPWSLWFQGNPHGQSLEEIGVVLIRGEGLGRQPIGPHFLVFFLQLRQPAFERGWVIVRSSNDSPSLWRIQPEDEDAVSPNSTVLPARNTTAARPLAPISICRKKCGAILSTRSVGHLLSQI